MPFNYAAMRLRADRMIARYGMPSAVATAVLRRGSVDRPCVAAEIAFSPKERRQLVNPTDRRYLVSAESTPVPPDQQLDTFVVKNTVTGADIEVLKIVEPPGKLAPAGIVVFWDLMVRG